MKKLYFNWVCSSYRSLFILSVFRAPLQLLANVLENNAAATRITALPLPCKYSASLFRFTFILHLEHVNKMQRMKTFWFSKNLINQWFPNFFLSRRILDKTEIIWRTSNIRIQNLFEFVIFSYPNVKSRQYCLSSQQI